MAGIKITDLAVLGTAASDDLLYIVDVSDTSQSPQGTSKSIEVGNILDFESGTWTPTFSGYSANLSNAIVLSAYYSRVGNIVSCTIYGSVDTDFSSLVQGNFDFTFPIAPVSSTARGVTSFNQYTNGASDAVIDDRIYLRALATDPLNSNQEFVASFQYSLI
jgi:hypothetical protein